MKNSLFSLITLYTSTRQERENRAYGEDRLHYNRLLAQQAQGGDNDEGQVEYEVTQAVKDLCRTLDGLIFVVDVTKNSQIGTKSLHIVDTCIALILPS